MPEDNTTLGANAVREIERITREAARAEIVSFNEVSYSTKQLHDPRKPEPTPTTVNMRTLQSFVEFVEDDQGHEVDYRIGRGHYVHVAEPHTVALMTGVFGEFHQRACMAQVEAILPLFPFGEFLAPEDFIIRLLTCFVRSDGRERVFAAVGNLADAKVLTLEDDGVTQTATFKAGVTRARTGEVPGAVELIPFRTFVEVEQVASPFVLRLRGGGEGAPPTCALFEADAGQWKLEAIENVKVWLREALGEGVPIYG